MRAGLFAIIVLLWISTGIGMAEYCPSGDMNGDCSVDITDLAILAEQWLDGPGCTIAAGDCADVTGNDGVNLQDFEALGVSWGKSKKPVVINEIHYDPDVKTDLCEFVELHNPTPREVDLSGWYFSAGIDYAFPAGSKIGAGGYLVVAQNAAKFQTKFGQIPFGQFAGKLSNDREMVRLKDAGGRTIDEVEYQLGFPWPTVGDTPSGGAAGSGYSIQLIHPTADNDLGGNWRGATPTPCAQNAFYMTSSPPVPRQVNHSPKAPKSGEPVKITIKVTDPDGIQSVVLKYQVVEPGQYINRTDAAYSTNWTTVDMYDNGTNGDELAGDDIYTAVLPGSLQVHRRLIRYKFTMYDTLGSLRNAPYAVDDPCPNFAYFVYNGVPPWTGAIRPGVDTPVTYGVDVMRSLPVYHLITKQADAEGSTWYQQYPWTDDSHFWYGTLVYDGEVYDHITYRPRGGCWRYAMGKNMWKFDFLRGHYFQARDDYGNKYDEKWNKLNFSACIQQGDYQHRGEQGMFEAVGFKLFNLAGIEASKTNWVQFRIIDEAAEFGATQYQGDFWGLYMAIENVDGHFLDEHGLPDGNLFKIDGGGPETPPNNQGATCVSDLSDIYGFLNSVRGGTNPTEAWWRANVDVNRYYAYRCVVEGIHHGDIAYGKNYFLYVNPFTQQWTQYIWDLDLTWANNMFGSGEDLFRNEGGIMGNAGLKLEFENKYREFIDLLYNPDQMNQLIDEYAAIIDTPKDGLTIVDADRAMWDYNPIMVSSYIDWSKAGQGRFYQQASTKDFRGMTQIMKDYVTGYRAFNTYWEDSAVPNKPTVTYAGTANYAVNDLRFQTTAFSDPQGAGTFAAMKWRIAEVEPDSTIVNPDPVTDTILIQPQSQWRYFKGTEEPSATYEEWRQLDFNDDPATTAWGEGPGPVGYDPSVSMGTRLSDMRYNYTTIYLRKEFMIDDPSKIDKLTLEALYDDGFNAWINGTRVANDYVKGENVPHNDTASGTREDNSYASFTISNPSDFLRTGRNVLAVQVVNIYLNDSSDAFFDCKLTAKPTTGDPDPQPLNYSRKARKYEIETVWESPEMTTFASTIQIPASAVKVNRTYRVRCRMKDTSGRWGHWSVPVQFTTAAPVAAGIIDNLRITEVMYNALPPTSGSYKADDFEYVELKNVGDETLDLTGVSFTSGFTYSFANAAVKSLVPGEFVLVVSNKAAFLSRYGSGLSGRVAGEYSSKANPQKLSNNGEGIRLEDYWNGVIADFEYSDGRLWPAAADGAGHSLVPLAEAIPNQAGGSYNYPAFWRASAFRNGSPGADDPEPTRTLLINEVMAHTDYTDPSNPLIDSNDWIEILNPGTGTIELGDYYLSDDADDLTKWRLPSGTLGAGERIVLDEVTGFHSPFPSGFGLNKAGEQVLLSYLPGTAEDRVADAVKFAGQENLISLGRYPDGGAYWLAMPMTRNQPNAVPVSHVVISEIQYHPADGGEEFIELHNPTGQAVPLFTEQGPWRISGGANFPFPASKSIAAGGRIVVVDFDPLVETVRFNAFKAAFPGTTFTAGVNLFGPWTGDLSNVAEKITLEKPILADLPDDPEIPWVVVDEVSYYDDAPWPVGADGTGKSIQRISTDATISGCEPTNWQIGDPSPAK
ncbi:MAG: hypothetical protein GX455_04895 [Phycisphaerae bacterium]|nr:hypothetical protein [Phycisphaerae bacterium]